MHEEKNKIDAKYRACFIGRLHIIVYCFKTGIFYILGNVLNLFVVIKVNYLR